MQNRHLNEIILLIERESIYQELIEFVYYLIKTKLEDAEDIVHEVFLLMFEKIEQSTLKEEVVITPQYFKACLRNYVWSKFRKKNHHTLFEQSQQTHRYSIKANIYRNSYSKLFKLLGMYISKNKILNDQEEIIWQAYADGLKPKEIEKKFNIKNASAKKVRILSKIYNYIPKHLFREFQDWFMELEANSEGEFELSEEEIINK